MNRTTEVEILAATLEEPARALVRAALVAQRQGRLDAAARVAADQVGKRPTLRWAALLLALDAAELRLGGSVAYTTPSARFAASESFPLFEERWGPFGAIVYPEGERLQLELVPAGSDAVHWFILQATPLSPEAGTSRQVVEAIHVLAKELEAHLGCGIKIG